MIKTAYASNIGRVRKTNQDFVQVFKNKKDVEMAIVADGMGGHLGGDVASSMAVQHLGHSFVGTDFDEAAKARVWLKMQLSLENETILKTSERFADLHGMGTTVVLALTFVNQVLVVHLGDSRGYLFRNNKLRQLTSDHSLVNELLKSKQITKEQAEHHPQKNVITETLGVSDHINPEYTDVFQEPGDIIMLCSDGLTNSLTDVQILTILLSEQDLQAKCDQLIKEANKFGGQDNITVCLVDYEKGGEQVD